jgi:hypothetical protein
MAQLAMILANKAGLLGTRKHFEKNFLIGSLLALKKAGCSKEFVIQMIKVIYHPSQENERGSSSLNKNKK